MRSPSMPARAGIAVTAGLLGWALGVHVLTYAALIYVCWLVGTVGRRLRRPRD